MGQSPDPTPEPERSAGPESDDDSTPDAEDADTGSTADSRADTTPTSEPAGRVVRFLSEREVAVEPTPVPDPGPGEVRVRTAVSAVSPGTELLVYRGQAPATMAADESIEALSGDLSFPLAYGYAAVGHVTAVGEGVDSGWLDRRVFAFHPHESHFLATPEDLVALDDPDRDLATETAALLPNAETAVNFALDGRPRIGERVAVFGQGVVGLLTTAVLAAHPLDRLVGVDLHERRRTLARELGADTTLDPTDGSTEGRPLSTDGDPARGAGPERDGDPGDRRRDPAVRRLYEGVGPPAGVDLSFELSGSPDALDQAIAATGYSGRVVVGSWYGDKRVDLDLGRRFHRSRVEVRSSQVSTVAPELRGRWDPDRRLDVALDRLAAVAADRLITHRVPVGDAADAYELLDQHPEDAVGVVFTYD
jgi:threonine dehydrogenase-like Zn-dependent dehydrogenase